MSPQHYIGGIVLARPWAALSCVLMTLTEGKYSVTFSYVGSSCTCMVSSALFDSCKAALIFTLLFLKIIRITIMKTIILTVRAVAGERIDIVYTAVLVPKLPIPVSVVLEL